MPVVNHHSSPSVQFFGSSVPYEICSINDQKFALFLKEISVTENLELHLDDYHVVVLAPMTAEDSITINARSIITLADVRANKGSAMISTMKHIVLLGGNIFGAGGTQLNSPEPILTLKAQAERSLFIKELFEYGLSEEDEEYKKEGLIALYDAIIDPFLDNDSQEVDATEAFSFFEIYEPIH